MQPRLVVKKGLDIKVMGKAEEFLVEVPRPGRYGLKPSDFHGITPKLLLREGASVDAGQPVFCSKDDLRIKFISPVSGRISSIERGEKRRILKIVIDAEDTDNYVKHDIPSDISCDGLKKLLLDSGCWALIKQRPYDIIAHPDDTPKSIFVSAYATAPLATSYEFALKEDRSFFQTGIDALNKLTPGDVHVCVPIASTLCNTNNAKIHVVDGCHPAGNVGVQIEKINPVNRNDRVWCLSPQDVVVIGKLIRTGQVDMSRVLAISGSEVDNPRHIKVKAGAVIKDFVGKLKSDNVRIISGDLLTGDKVGIDDFLGYYHNLVTVIPEGDNYRMFGWMPFKDNGISSFYNTSLYKLFSKVTKPDTNLNGEERAMVVTGKMERVMPMDIYPMQLLKECLSKNIERMELLGIYEVAPEDFALIDYISTSKIEAQDIIRKGLDLMIKEVG